jgi:hypothetical protein
MVHNMRKTLVATGASMLVCASLALAAGGSVGTLNSGANGGGSGGSHGGAAGAAHVFAAIAGNGAAGAGGTRGNTAAAAHGVTFTTGTVNGQEAKIALVTLTKPLSPAEKAALHQLGYDEVHHEGLTYYCSSAFSKGGYTGNICFMTTILRQPPR